jgi:hypothetical protein
VKRYRRLVFDGWDSLEGVGWEVLCERDAVEWNIVVSFEVV